MKATINDPSVTSQSIEDGTLIKKRHLPDNEIVYLDPIWLFDDSKGKPYLREIKNQPWFHGYRDKSDLQVLLREIGDWIVKYADSNPSDDIIIVVRVTKKILAYYPLAASDEKFWFLSSAKREKNIRYFLNQVDLVEYYQNEKLPGKYYMKTFICRPCWLIKSINVDYDNETDLIKQGSFSSIYSGRYYMINKQRIQVAVKEYKISEENKRMCKNRINDLIAESKILSYLIHTNVLQFYGIIDEDPRIRVLEICSGGSLSSHLKKEKEISFEELYLYCYEICRGLEYLHKKGCIHKNLKCQNILISSQGSLKIGGYEFNSITYKKFGKITSFMAPEILRKDPQYSQKSDIWSMAIVIHEIFCNGNVPLQNEKEEIIKNAITKGTLWEIPQIFPRYLAAKVKLMLLNEPNDRLPIKHLKRYFVDKIALSRRMFSPDKLTLNKIHGVKRGKFYIKYTNKDQSDGRSSSSSDDFYRKM